VTGEKALKSPWGWQYSVDEVLSGDTKPVFFAIDNKGRKMSYKLDIVG
jgi:hypothetical protein